MIDNLDDFKKAVEQGLIKDKWYFYKRTEETKQAQTEEIPYLITFFRVNFGVTLYPIYGTLLGIVRENDYILHDNDIDFAYLSKYSDAKSIISEYQYICAVLEKNKLFVKSLSNGHLHCFGQGGVFKFDIWTSFIRNHKLSIVPLISGTIEKNALLPFKKQSFRNITIWMPHISDIILDNIYDNWEKSIYGEGVYRGIKQIWKKLL
jgi:hypothetical protein